VYSLRMQGLTVGVREAPIGLGPAAPNHVEVPR
jgi:hypothetical protein